jgi:hypothetical protein
MSVTRRGPHPATVSLAAWFEQNLLTPIHRDTIVADWEGSQRDPLKRVRRNGGARELLDPKGIAILWGRGDRKIINQLGIGPVGDDYFISYKPKNQQELDLLRDGRNAELGSPRFP